MKRILNKDEQIRLSTTKINELYTNLFVFATNVETDNDGTDYCIPRIICSSEQRLTAEDTIQYKMNELKYGILAYLDYTPKPDLLFL